MKVDESGKEYCFKCYKGIPKGSTCLADSSNTILIAKVSEKGYKIQYCVKNHYVSLDGQKCIVLPEEAVQSGCSAYYELATKYGPEITCLACGTGFTPLDYPIS
jgi:hypothetical protein